MACNFLIFLIFYWLIAFNKFCLPCLNHPMTQSTDDFSQIYFFGNNKNVEEKKYHNTVPTICLIMLLLIC